MSTAPTICIKDYVGFLSLNDALNRSVIQYLSHSNQFCKYLKSDKDVYQRCLSMMPRLKKNFTSRDTVLCGVCHAGIKEYAVPVFCKDVLVGSVHAGAFRSSSEKAARHFKGLCSAAVNLDKDIIHSLYLQCQEEPQIDTDLLIASLRIIANCLSFTVRPELLDTIFQGKRTKSLLEQNNILSEATNYLRSHYTLPCDVSALAKICRCSRSQLSHLFKKRMGISIPAYINHLRMEKAKESLLNTDLSVSDIAFSLGYNDPNYFSRNFIKYYGISCRRFRLQNRSMHKDDPPAAVSAAAPLLAAPHFSGGGVHCGTGPFPSFRPEQSESFRRVTFRQAGYPTWAELAGQLRSGERG